MSLGLPRCLRSAAALILVGAASLSAQTVRAGNGTAAAPSVTFNNSLTLGLYRFGADTLGIATGGAASLGIRGGAAVTLFGGAGNMTIQAGTGNSRTLTLRTTTSGGTAKNTLVLGADSSATFLGQLKGMDGSSSVPTYSFTSAPNTGFYLNGSAALFTNVNGDQVKFQNAGVAVTATGTATTAAYSWISDANTGMYRIGADTLGFTSGGTASHIITATRDSTPIRAVFTGDTIRTTSKVRATALTAASGTPNTVCIDATTKEFLENAAATCTVSSRRYKDSIAPLPPMWDALARLKPVSFVYKSGGRRAIGLIAEDVAAIDTRLVTYDAQGRPNSVNYEEMSVVLLSVVQEQQKQLDDIQNALLGLGSVGVVAGAVAARRRKKTT